MSKKYFFEQIETLFSFKQKKKDDVELFSGSGGTASSEPTIVTVGERMEDGVRIVFLPEGISSDELFARYGELPLPPRQAPRNPVFSGNLAIPVAGFSVQGWKALKSCRARSTMPRAASVRSMRTFRPASPSRTRSSASASLKMR